jgi:hypothetical protein
VLCTWPYSCICALKFMQRLLHDMFPTQPEVVSACSIYQGLCNQPVFLGRMSCHHLNGERCDTSVIKIYQDISRYIKIYQDTAWQDMARLKDQDRPSMFHDSSIWAFSTTKTENRTTTGRKNERHVCHMSLARLLAAAFPTGHAEELGPSRPGIAFVRIDCEHLWTS